MQNFNLMLQLQFSIHKNQYESYLDNVRHYFYHDQSKIMGFYFHRTSKKQRPERYETVRALDYLSMCCQPKQCQPEESVC